MSYLTMQTKYIKKKQATISRSKWVLNESGQLIGFDEDLEKAIDEMGISISSKIDQMISDALFGRSDEASTAR